MKILLAEDSRAVASAMSARLHAFGHEVVLAENGKVGVEKFREVAPDLVLMDIEMPVMNGFEATNRIRGIEAAQQWAWTPIIFLTASDTVENLVTAIEAGGDDFMSKSAPEAVLQAKMKAMNRIANLRQRLSVANRKLEEMANLDGLTGLCNRRSMDVRVDQLWTTATDTQCAFGLLMIDIDNFKKYNDRYGHPQGDECLRTVADLFSVELERFRGTGKCKDAFVARYGGEEFSVALLDPIPTAVFELANQLLEAVRALKLPHERNEAWGVVTVSIGGSWMNPASGQPNVLFRSADEHLYRAKDAGRNRAECLV